MRLWSQWKLIPGLQIVCLRWPAAEAASWHQWESQRTRVPSYPPPLQSHGSFYWISERNVYKMTTVLLKTECGGNIGQGSGLGEDSNHGKWNESVALKVLAASACPHPSTLRGNFRESAVLHRDLSQAFGQVQSTGTITKSTRIQAILGHLDNITSHSSKSFSLVKTQRVIHGVVKIKSWPQSRMSRQLSKERRRDNILSVGPRWGCAWMRPEHVASFLE